MRKYLEAISGLPPDTPEEAQLWSLYLGINDILGLVMRQPVVHHLLPEEPVGPLELERRVDFLGLTEAAKKAQKIGLSYRNFLVGCAIWAVDSETHAESIFVGCNIKVSKDARPICAEQVAVGAARAAGYDHILAMAVVGEPQEENGILPKTLHPCKECLRVFQAMPEICPETVLLTMTPSGAQERFCMGDLINFRDVGCSP